MKNQKQKRVNLNNTHQGMSEFYFCSQSKSKQTIGQGRTIEYNNNNIVIVMDGNKEAGKNLRSYSEEFWKWKKINRKLTPIRQSYTSQMPKVQQQQTTQNIKGKILKYLNLHTPSQHTEKYIKGKPSKKMRKQLLKGEEIKKRKNLSVSFGQRQKMLIEERNLEKEHSLIIKEIKREDSVERQFGDALLHKAEFQKVLALESGHFIKSKFNKKKDMNSGNKTFYQKEDNNFISTRYPKLAKVKVSIQEREDFIEPWNKEEDVQNSLPFQ